MNHELPDVQAGFRRVRGTRDQIEHSSDHWKARAFQKNIYFCFIGYAKDFDCVDHNKLENSERDGNARPPYLHLRKMDAGQEAIVRTGHGMMDWFQIGKGVCQGCISPILYIVKYVKAAYLTFMQSTSCEMPGRMKHKLESRMPGEISITSDMQMIPPLWQKVKRN